MGIWMGIKVGNLCKQKGFKTKSGLSVDDLKLRTESCKYLG